MIKLFSILNNKTFKITRIFILVFLLTSCGVEKEYYSSGKLKRKTREIHDSYVKQMINKLIIHPGYHSDGNHAIFKRKEYYENGKTFFKSEAKIGWSFLVEHNFYYLDYTEYNIQGQKCIEIKYDSKNKKGVVNSYIPQFSTIKFSDIDSLIKFSQHDLLKRVCGGKLFNI